MAHAQPLWHRLYFQEPYSELARIIGYNGRPVPEVVTLSKPLLDKHGRAKMDEASQAIARIDDATKPPTVRLTDEARKLCWQLLGPPPEHPDYSRLRPNGQQPAADNEPTPSPEKPKCRPRKRLPQKGATDGSPSNVEPSATSVQRA